MVSVYNGDNIPTPNQTDAIAIGHEPWNLDTYGFSTFALGQATAMPLVVGSIEIKLFGLEQLP